ncbi:MAG: hypothetical protein JXR30_00005 [Alphaproteobacteria bacterium]|nr:hypothetical protein [Alphaproteobacteria bacterium]
MNILHVESNIRFQEAFELLLKARFGESLTLDQFTNAEEGIKRRTEKDYDFIIVDGCFSFGQTETDLTNYFSQEFGFTYTPEEEKILNSDEEKFGFQKFIILSSRFNGKHILLSFDPEKYRHICESASYGAIESFDKMEVSPLMDFLKNNER